MSSVLTSRWRRMLAALPAVPEGAELILRDGRDGATATFRVPGAPPRVVRDEQDGVAELRPGEDDGLVGRALLADREHLAAALAPFVGELRDARLVAWRPRRRAVLRLEGVGGDVHWLKLLDRKGYRRAVGAFAALGGALAPLRLAVPQRLLPDHAAYLAPNADGRSLREVLAAGGDVPWPLVTRALLSLSYTPLDGQLPVLDFAAVRDAAVGMLQKGAAILPEVEAPVARLAALHAPACAFHGLVHGDLHDKQVFVGRDALTMIDLEGVGVGDGRFDFANLVEHVRLRDLQQYGEDRGGADHLSSRLGQRAEDVATRAFRAVVRARLCGVYAQRPRWHGLVQRLLAEVVTLLEELS